MPCDRAENHDGAGVLRKAGESIADIEYITTDADVNFAQQSPEAPGIQGSSLFPVRRGMGIGEDRVPRTAGAGMALKRD